MWQLPQVRFSGNRLTVTTGGEPYCRSAGWSRNLGAFALLVVLVALLFHAFGVAETPAFFASLALAMLAAMLAVLVAVRALIIIWRRGKPGMGDALLGLTYGLLL